MLPSPDPASARFCAGSNPIPESSIARSMPSSLPTCLPCTCLSLACLAIVLKPLCTILNKQMDRFLGIVGGDVLWLIPDHHALAFRAIDIVSRHRPNNGAYAGSLGIGPELTQILMLMHLVLRERSSAGTGGCRRSTSCPSRLASSCCPSCLSQAQSGPRSSA